MFIKAHDKAALIWEGEEITYRELLRSIDYYSSLLGDKIIDKVAIFSENCPQWIYSYYAAWKVEAASVPIDHLASADEVSYIINDCKPEAIFCSGKNYEILIEALKNVTYKPKVICFNEIPEKAYELVNGDLEKLPEFERNKVATIIYTSGTTGSPKGVMLTFANLYSVIDSLIRDKLFTPKRKVMVLLPLHHIWPLQGSVLSPLYAGGTLIFCPSISGSHIIDTLKEYKVSAIIGVPKLYEVILKGILKKINANLLAKILYKISKKILNINVGKILFKKVHKGLGGKLEFLGCGGAALDPEIIKGFIALGFEMIEGYGMTESAPLISYNRHNKTKIGSVGKVAHNTIIKIVDEEILVSGLNVMYGYYNRPEETNKILQDGWLYTGDKGIVDKKGYLYITGRIKDIIILPNGKNINPEEIEIKLKKMNEDILEIGIYENHSKLNGIVYLDPESEKDIEKMKMEMKKTLDNYNKSVSGDKKVLKIKFSTEDLPKTRIGKIRRFLLKDFANDF